MCPGYWHSFQIWGTKFGYCPNYCRKFSLHENYKLSVFGPICFHRTSALCLSLILLANHAPAHTQLPREGVKSCPCPYIFASPPLRSQTSSSSPLSFVHPHINPLGLPGHLAALRPNQAPTRLWAPVLAIPSDENSNSVLISVRLAPQPLLRQLPPCRPTLIPLFSTAASNTHTYTHTHLDISLVKASVSGGFVHYCLPSTQKITWNIVGSH